MYRDCLMLTETVSLQLEMSQDYVGHVICNMSTMHEACQGCSNILNSERVTFG